MEEYLEHEGLRHAYYAGKIENKTMAWFTIDWEKREVVYNAIKWTFGIYRIRDGYIHPAMRNDYRDAPIGRWEQMPKSAALKQGGWLIKSDGTLCYGLKK